MPHKNSNPRPDARWALPVAAAFFCLSIACFFIHFVSFRHSIPPNNVDEASFFSPAQNLAEHGSFASPIHEGFLPGAEHYTYWMPPLYMVLLAGVFKLFGATVLNAKLFTFFLIGLSAFLITLLSQDRYIKLCLAGLFLVCPFIIISSAFIRMEGLALFLMTVAIVAVRFQVRTIWLGILAGLMAMTHPMLMPSAVALAVYVARRGFVDRKGIRPFLLFCLLALLTISPYLIYVLRDLPAYKLQMGLQLARKAHKRLLGLKLDYIVQSVPLAVLALCALLKLRKDREQKLFLGIGLTLTLLLVLKSDEYNYQVYVIPFVVAILGLFLDEKENRGRPVYRYALPLTIYGVFAIFLIAKLVKYKFRDDRSYREMITYIKSHREWEGKNIFVDGTPDLSTFLMMEHQHVQRRNAVANEIKDSALNKYDYVIEVSDKETRDPNIVRDGPWQIWPVKRTFTTSNGIYSVKTYSPVLPH